VFNKLSFLTKTRYKMAANNYTSTWHLTYPRGPSYVVELLSNSYKPMNNAAWVSARLCKLHKRVNSSHKW